MASPTSAASPPTTGSMIKRCSTGRAMPTSRWIFSTTTAPTLRLSARHRPSHHTRRPPTLGGGEKKENFCPADGAYPYKRDLPDVEFHLIDTGHFALEDKADEMVPLIRDFLNRNVKRK